MYSLPFQMPRAIYRDCLPLRCPRRPGWRPATTCGSSLTVLRLIGSSAAGSFVTIGALLLCLRFSPSFMLLAPTLPLPLVWRSRKSSAKILSLPRFPSSGVCVTRANPFLISPSSGKTPLCSSFVGLAKSVFFLSFRGWIRRAPTLAFPETRLSWTATPGSSCAP